MSLLESMLQEKATQLINEGKVGKKLSFNTISQIADFGKNVNKNVKALSTYGLTEAWLYALGPAHGDETKIKLLSSAEKGSKLSVDEHGNIIVTISRIELETEAGVETLDETWFRIKDGKVGPATGV